MINGLLGVRCAFIRWGGSTRADQHEHLFWQRPILFFFFHTTTSWPCLPGRPHLLQWFQSRSGSEYSHLHKRESPAVFLDCHMPSLLRCTRPAFFGRSAEPARAAILLRHGWTGNEESINGRRHLNCLRSCLGPPAAAAGAFAAVVTVPLLCEEVVKWKAQIAEFRVKTRLAFSLIKCDCIDENSATALTKVSKYMCWSFMSVGFVEDPQIHEF